MPDIDIPFIAVIGGLRELEDPALFEEAKAEGRRIGEHLAKAGFGLTVYFSDERSLEPHVVSGYIAALAENQGHIRVHFASSQRKQVRFAEEANARSGLFKRIEDPSTEWEQAFYWSLAVEGGVDAVLLLGGRNSVLIAGTIAVARNMPLLIVNQFGGSAETIWKNLPKDPNGKPPPAWGAEVPDTMLADLKKKSLEAKQMRKLSQSILDDRRQKMWIWFAASFAFLLLLFYFGIKAPFPSAYAYTMFLSLIPAGATGAVGGALATRSVDRSPLVSLLLGGFAGFVVGVAYLIPQLVADLPGGVLGTGLSEIKPVNIVAFISAMLVAIPAGMGFEVVIARLFEDSKKLPISPQK